MNSTGPGDSIPLEAVGGLPVVTAPADIDHSNVGQLREVLAAALADCATVVVDMTANEFCDSSALAALVQANRHAESAGGEIRLVMDGGAVRRIFKLTGVDRVFRMFDDIPAAVSAPGGPSSSV